MADIPAKQVVEPVSSDKIIYYYKLFGKEPLANPCHPLGTQGATSGTNTAALGTTPTKQFNIKDTGAINQQRVVNVILTQGNGMLTDVARDLYYAWEHHMTIALYRVDWNTVQVVNNQRVVNVEYSQCKISALPETEALNTPVSENITFEITGIARRYDEDGHPYTLGEADFEPGTFNLVSRFYNFTKPSEVGLDADGNVTDNSSDDSHTGTQGGVELGAKVDAGQASGGSTVPSGSNSGTGTNTK